MIHAIYVHADIIPVPLCHCKNSILFVTSYCLHVHTLKVCPGRLHVDVASWGFVCPYRVVVPTSASTHAHIISYVARQAVYTTTIAKNSWFPLQESYSSGREPSKYLLRNRSDVAVLQHAIAIPNQQFLHRHSFILGIFCGNHILPIHIPLL